MGEEVVVYGNCNQHFKPDLENVRIFNLCLHWDRLHHLPYCLSVHARSFLELCDWPTSVDRVRVEYQLHERQVVRSLPTFKYIQFYLSDDGRCSQYYNDSSNQNQP